MTIQLIILLIAAGTIGLFLGWGLSNRVRDKTQNKPDLTGESKSYLKGLNYMIARQPDKAIAEFTKLVKLHPDTVEIYLSLGNLFREQGDMERAIRLHQSIILRPNLEQQIKRQALLDLGLDYQKAGLIDRSISTYREIISQQPEHLLAHQQLEKLYEEEKDWEQAYMAQRKILRLTRSKDQSILAHLQVQLGRVSYEQGQIKESLKRLKTAIDLDPSCSEAHLFLGDIYLAQGKLRSAISVWEGIIQAGLSFSCLAYAQLEEAYLAQNKYDHIKTIYEGVLAKNPADIRTRLALAKYYQRLGRLENAREEVKRALKHQPQSNTVKLYLLELMMCEAGGKIPEEYRYLFGEFRLESIPYQCEKCGYHTTDTLWKCPRCREWDTFTDSLSSLK
jgi:lipopolysaccharide biosynthesis regulator YciM